MLTSLLIFVFDFIVRYTKQVHNSLLARFVANITYFSQDLASQYTAMLDMLNGPSHLARPTNAHSGV